jgi:tetratricopeptide (TPR) repeat protein/predicted Ser/Thr protein kinase
METDRPHLASEIEEPTRMATESSGTIAIPDEPFVPRHYGKYSVTSVLGRGGMGVVYRATDPDLERDVAVKVLRRPTAAGDRDADRIRLLREAKALAKLSHPNVVTVYDVGDAGGELYVAMELIEGRDLRSWLKESKRSVAEILAVFVAAGRGMQAAHAAGLVHRDFKPTNVLIGSDGRVRVTDFGLARSPRVNPDLSPAASSSMMEVSLETELTMEGVVVGTPAYMAPEQHERRQLTPAADQYAFCIALHEAIYGERPFSGTNLYQLKLEGPVMPPLRRDVPGRVARAIHRGMAPAPAGRHGSMDALLRELQLDPTMGRRRMLLFGGIALAAVAVWAWGQINAKEDSPCSIDATTLAGAWDENVSAAVLAAFEASGRSYAATAHEALAGDLDAYAEQWIESRQDACEATRVRGDQSDSLLDQRVACLDDRREALGALAQALTEAEATVVDRANELARELPPIEACEDARSVAARVPDPSTPRIADAVAEARADLAVTRAFILTGRFEEAAASVEQALPEVRALDYAPLLAEVLVSYGEALDALARHEEAEAAFEEAAWKAYAVGYDEMVVAAAHKLVWNLHDYQGRVEAGLVWAKLAESTVARGRADPLAQASVINARGALLHDAGKEAEAIEAYERSIALVEEHSGKDALPLAGALVNLAIVEQDRGRFRRALQLQKRALAIREAHQGRAHPDTAVLLNNMSSVLLGLERSQEALEFNREAISRLRAAFGNEHPLVATALGQRGALQHAEGDRAGALESMQEAADMFVATRGPKLRELGVLYNNIGYLLLEEGRRLEARDAFERSLAVYRDLEALDHPSTASARLGLAKALRELGDDAQAKPLYDDVLTRIRAGDAGMLEHRAEAFLGAAEVYEKLGDPKAAAALRREASADAEG